MTTNMALVASAGVTRSAVLFVSRDGLHGGGERPQLRTARLSVVRHDRGFMDCQLCEGESTSNCAALWRMKVQWRLNFSGRSCKKSWHIRGMLVSSAAEAAETYGMQATEVGLSRQVIPKHLIGKSYRELERIVYSFGGGATTQQKYRAKQMHQLIYKNKVNTIQECAQLPKQLRDAMESEGWSIGRSPIHHIVNSIDGTVKILLRLEDCTLVEAVGIPVISGRASRLTACVSSQVGCPLKCSFCATGKGGLGRNLHSHEIVDQVLAIEDLFRQPVTDIAFMGMGEPLMNLGAVLDAHRAINKELKMPQDMMTISTVGVPNTIRRFAAHKLQSKLVVSLHAPNQELRSEIVPSAKRYPLDVLMEDCEFYYETNHHRLSFDYTLLAGVNDHREQAEELATLLHHWNFSHVNLTPYNSIADSDFERPTKAKVLAFVETLAKRKVTTSVTTAWGLDANAAYGQLRNEHQKFPLQSSIGVHT